MKQLEIFQNLTSLQGESHANLSAWQDSKKARKTLDTSGRACLKSLSTKDPLMLLSKMLVASSMWHSTRCALNWKVKATPQGRLYFQLQASTLPTKEIESGVSERNLWATPQLTDGTRINQKPRAKEDLTEAAKQGGCSNLREQVHENFWRTPTTMDAKGDALKHATKLLQGKTKRASGEQVQITLVDQVMMEEIRQNPDLMKEFEDHIIVVRPNLPPQNCFVEYIREQTSVKELAEKTDILKTTIEHWFRKDKSGFSHPSVVDWETIKPFLDDKGARFDEQMTTIEEAEWEQTKDASLWPTPRATTRMAYFEQPSPSMIKGTHGWNLNAAVTDAESENPHRLWPTPTQDSATERTKKYAQGGKPLTVAVQEEEQKKMWPTPRAAIGMHMKMSQGLSDLQHKRYLETEVAHEHIEVEKQKPGGHLNADWVEWLMGYGKGYTDLSIDEKLTLKDHQGFYEEPRTSRVTHNQQDKVNRLKSLGNSIVPQIAYNLGLAIIEDYNHGK
jgi:hypothetical protein